MKANTYKLLDGSTVTYSAEPRAAEFLARVVDATSDPRVTYAELSGLVYGKENPVLKQDPELRYGLVTAETIANPLYLVMTDLLGRKREASVAATAGEYTVTVSQAAAQLGVHPSAVRQAIAAGRIPAKKFGAAHMLRPDDVAAFRPGRHGRARLEVRMGNKPGVSFRVQTEGGEVVVDKRKSHIIEGHVSGFRRVAVLGILGGKHVLYVLEPGEKPSAVTLDEDFYVRGRFRMAKEIHQADAARAAWKAFGAEREADAHAE